jgi:rhamnosyltransferase
MSSPSSIAVLLATYNGMKWIEEQVESILNQQSVDVNIYISVDLSTDNTYQWCQDLAKQNVHVKVLPYGERFGGAAKNFFRLIRDVDFSYR